MDDSDYDCLYSQEPELFTPEFDISDRYLWLCDLSHKFSCLPYTSVTEEVKILIARKRLCREYSKIWDNLSQQASPEERERLKTWQVFEDWTLTLLDIRGVVDLMALYEHARHKPSDEPTYFAAYLGAIWKELEKHFEPRSEKELSLTFFVKLDPDLQCDIRRCFIGSKDQMPENVPDMVRFASERWRDRKAASEIMHQANRGKGSGSSRGNHRGRGRSSQNSRGCGKKQQRA